MKRRIFLFLFMAIALTLSAQTKKVALLETLNGDKAVQVKGIEINMVRGELRKAISNQQGFQAFTRTDIDQLMKEHNFQNSGMVSDAQRKKLGEMSGADYICVSTLTKSDTEFYLEAYLIDVETGEISNPATQYGILEGGTYANLFQICQDLAHELIGYVDSSGGSGNTYTSITPTNRSQLHSANGHEYVDLGLPSGTLWATCNVGANRPEDFGNYYAWGETKTKGTYNWATYKYSNGDNNKLKLNKYCNNSDYGDNGFKDDLTTLQDGDDAASAIWGHGWRTPTEEQWDELYQNTVFKRTEWNGVEGVQFVALNGQKLFLPAAGSYFNNTLYEAGSKGNYWLRSIYPDDPTYANCFNLETWEFVSFIKKYECRIYGFSIRAVREK